MTITTSPITNASVWHASSAALYAGEVDAFLEHWCPDGRYAVAYPVPGVPAVVEGRDDLRVLFCGFASMAVWIRVADVRFHATANPGVAFVEQHMTAQLHDGSGYENDLCLRVTFRDGRIAEVLEYYGQKAHGELMARLGAGAQR